MCVLSNSAASASASNLAFSSAAALRSAAISLARALLIAIAFSLLHSVSKLLHSVFSSTTWGSSPSAKGMRNTSSV